MLAYRKRLERSKKFFFSPVSGIFTRRERIRGSRRVNWSSREFSRAKRELTPREADEEKVAGFHK